MSTSPLAAFSLARTLVVPPDRPAASPGLQDAGTPVGAHDREKSRDAISSALRRRLRLRETGPA